MEGVRILSELLKSNTTLTSIDISCEEISGSIDWARGMSKEHTVNEVGIEGAKSISEALEVNTTLMSLDMSRCCRNERLLWEEWIAI